MAGPIAEVRRFLTAALISPDPGTPVRPKPGPAALRRRRIAVVVTLVVGAVTLFLALRIEPGDPAFYLTTAVLALVWAGGAVASGPLHLGHSVTRAGRTDGRAVVQSLVLAGLLLGVFLLGALVVAQVPFLRAPVIELLDHARFGVIWLVLAITVLNGVAEEIFFRGALFSSMPPRRAVLVTTVLYAASTVGSGVPLLVLAAVVIGAVTGMQRRVTGGVLGPIITHVVWSSGMVLLLPLVLG
ncbi:CPBP family intramembrane glutamic endopeptidase [Litorihabitans aurantiacus]|uniref:Abortive infection protein n=1 Tax=Litorihabitans aurantiacus TaxID=1930061 RepID=A0AA38CT33_9MICO|nr:CPBP family intramembrane glutamic endopeptidase [Litorihabitans aurantiacus]GMA32064.1 abortive infection protein [Litorihabitans aurantiacus]